MEPTVSIVIPIYNSAEYLAQCLDSCLIQTIETIEILCVDDGSSDASESILTEYSRIDKRVHVFRQSHQGAAAARNQALSHAQGKYIAFMDSDDYYPIENALSLLVRAAEENDVEIAGGSMCMDRAGVIDLDSLHGEELDSFDKERIIEYKDYQYNYDYTRYIYSRKMLASHGIQFPPYSLFEDPPFFIRAMLAAKRFYAIPETVYCYRHSLHDAKEWTVEHATDRLRGIIDCLAISSKWEYSVLHHHVANQLKYEAPHGYIKNIENDKLLYLLCKATSMVNIELIKTTFPDYGDVFIPESLIELSVMPRELEVSKNTLAELSNSTTLKVGKALMKVPCAVKDFFGRHDHE